MRLRRRTVNSNIDDVGASHRRGDHGGGRDTRGVVRVDVDGEVGVLLPDRGDETVPSDVSLAQPDSLRDASYILAASGLRTPAISLIPRT